MGTDHMFELHDFEEEKRIITKPFICRFDFEEHIFSCQRVLIYTNIIRDIFLPNWLRKQI